MVGLFFGSFNPVHNGHLMIANFMTEIVGLTEVWFVVSPQNPLKNKAGLLAENHRLNLVKEAIGDYPKFKTSDIEFKMPKPSYTIDTLAYLGEKYPKQKFALLMGADNLQTLDKWKNYEQLIQNYSIYVYPRVGFNGGVFKTHPNVVLTEAPQMEISSTFIRDAVKNGKDIRYFLPESAYKYLKEMHFYEK